jgi:hypothetical protein
MSQVRSCQERSPCDEVRSGPVRIGKEWCDEVRSGPVRIGKEWCD